MTESTLVERVAGEGRAMNFMVLTLIATHPEPRALLARWRQCVTEWIDELAVHPSAKPGSPFHAAVQARLAEYQAVIERAAAESSEE